MNAITTMQRGLMYIRVIVDGKEMITMMDKGDTNNFVILRIVDKFGLSMTKVTTKIKVVRSAT